MTYKINGVEIQQPTVGKWIRRDPLGISGSGQAVYPAVREFEMTWIISTPTEFNQLLGTFQAIGLTGTTVVDLPTFGDASYTFTSYTGCVLREPEMGRYFTEHYQEVLLLVTNIRT